MKPPTILAALPALIATAALAVGCAGSDDRLTLDQYASFCADGIASAANLIEPDATTWADLIALAEPSLERLRAVDPPQALGDFHSASIRTLDFIVDVAYDQPLDEPANPLAFGFTAIRIATQLSRAVDALPPEVRRRLSEAGCL